jgi:uncharacterized repeat protein (TIGR03803 family)
MNTTICKGTGQMAVASLALIALATHSMISAAPAQSFTTLKSFGIFTNVSGLSPSSKLVQGGDGTLYGTATSGDGYIEGTIFKIQPDGSGFAVLKRFTSPNEGRLPVADLSLSGGTLYGTTLFGGSSGAGTVFKINTDGTGYTVLKHFTDSDGINPSGGLTLSGSTLYGTTMQGGWNFGTVFKVNTDGTGFTVLKHCIPRDGVTPQAGLTLSGSTLYGTTTAGGLWNYGTVFKMNTDGTEYTVMKAFTGTDGSSPQAGITLSGSTLYGTTTTGGSSFNGTIFKMNTDGTGFTVLKHFPAFPSADGGLPQEVLAVSGHYTVWDDTSGWQFGLRHSL